MAGSMISLWMSRYMAKWMMGVEVIDADTDQTTQKELFSLVSRLSSKAGLEKMPEVGIYEANEVNAFATGPTRKRALVAVSSGLLRRMDWNEIEGVLGHELSHVANGDMVTMTLLQGVVNAFVMFLARMFAFVLSGMMRQKENESQPSYLFTVFIYLFEVVFMILGSLVVAAFSRHREYEADAGGAKLAGREKMIKALEELEIVSSIHDKNEQTVASFRALMIAAPSTFMRLFASHPPIQDRIARLKGAQERV